MDFSGRILQEVNGIESVLQGEVDVFAELLVRGGVVEFLVDACLSDDLVVVRESLAVERYVVIT